MDTDWAPLVSIIIPVKEINHHVEKGVCHILAQSYSNFEIIILPDRANGESFPKTRVVPTWPAIGPADKRDLGAELANGEALAFLDDDAYPAPGWLAAAVPYFRDPSVAAVCGPAVTPPENSIWQRASGWVFASRLGGGNHAYRVVPAAKRKVDDFPSVNLLVRKADFFAAGGFDSHFWPGEDTKLCHDLVHRLGKRIHYDPEILVYHHRRPLFRPHLQQIGRYGLHRGYFARVLPRTSLRLSYFLPSFLSLGLVLGLLMPWEWLRYAYVGGLGLYLLLLIGEGLRAALKERDVRLLPLVSAGIASTHLWYGVRFIQGLFSPHLTR